MLYLLTGRTGSGKTRKSFAAWRQRERRPQLLLVPEQASFETERRFCRENGKPGRGLWGGPSPSPAWK